MFSFAVWRQAGRREVEGVAVETIPGKTCHSTHLENKFYQTVAADRTLLFLASGCCGGVTLWLREQDDRHFGGSCR